MKSYTLGPTTGTYSDLEEVFGYDFLNRLTSANLAAGQAQNFTYDAVGNRTNATINAASTTYNYPGTSHKLSSHSPYPNLEVWQYGDGAPRLLYGYDKGNRGPLDLTGGKVNIPVPGGP